MSNGVILCWEKKQKEILDDGKKKTQCQKPWELAGESQMKLIKLFLYLDQKLFEAWAEK